MKDSQIQVLYCLLFVCLMTDKRDLTSSLNGEEETRHYDEDLKE